MNMYLYPKFIKALSLSCILILSASLYAQNSNPYQYISPRPGSIMVSAETNIIVRHSNVIDPAALSDQLIIVEGSTSGIHTGEFLLSDDNKTLVFNPDIAFVTNEVVKVLLMEGGLTLSGSSIPEFSFSFKTVPAGIVQIPDAAFEETALLTDSQDPIALKRTAADAWLPAPPITIDSIDNPSDGYIFMATWDRNMPALYGNFIFILDKNGALVDSIRVDGAPYDFQIQANGLLSYALGDFAANVPLPGEELQHMVLDESLAVVDSFRMKNGYITDFHEFKILPNGHVMMMAYHTIRYDMSTVVEGGQPDASLVINIIQEQDLDKNVVFEWRNIDYIPITDSDLDLTASRINYGTLNAFDMDDDGNILASFRNHSEIMKISRQTGELIWRMGGPRGEFTYVGEHEENAPYYHARQHNIHRRPNGNITLFDNGEFHQPPYSRAVEYALDEENKVATLVSEWRYPFGNIFCVTAGNAEPLSNGGWFIGYGVPNQQFVVRNAVEVHPDGSNALELSLPRGVLAYRAYKFPWKETVNKPGFTHYEVRGGSTYSFNNETITTGVDITYNALDAADYNESTITRIPYGPVDPEFIDDIITVYPVSIDYEVFAISSQSAEFHVDLAVYPEILDPKNTVVYLRENPGQGLFIPFTTTWDSINNELVVTLNSYGEIVFGVPAADIDNEVPIQYQPFNQQKLVLQDSISIRWTGKGLYDSFNLQVASDSDFTTILHDINTNLSDYSMKELANNTTYFWRVNSELGDQTSLWSEVWSFEITDPYISTVIPNGGEIWANGNTEVIRWETNVLEGVRIDLLQNQSFLLALDTLPGSQQAYSWTLPDDLQTGENFSIKVSSETNSSIFGISEDVFTIVDTVTGLEAYDKIPQGYSLAQNFPNPFYQTTRISYSLQKSNKVSLKVYTLIGEEIYTLINEFQEAGTYSTIFDARHHPGGIYFYKLQLGDRFVEAKKMILVR